MGLGLGLGLGLESGLGGRVKVGVGIRVRARVGISMGLGVGAAGVGARLALVERHPLAIGALCLHAYDRTHASRRAELDHHHVRRCGDSQLYVLSVARSEIIVRLLVTVGALHAKGAGTCEQRVWCGLRDGGLGLGLGLGVGLGLGLGLGVRARARAS